ncbi:MAG: dynamin family protein [Anaerolineae bacterium]|nr:dynamin family protein [Anaerolineae bacterium]
MLSTMPTVLTERQGELWRDERRLLERLLSLLSRWETSADELAVLRQALAQLDELFLLVIAGEFNSGKTALINALLGERYLTEGVTPTTAEIHLLRYGDKGPGQRERGLLIMTYPAPFLREINVVDTPGTNAILREHEEITREFVPRSDLVLFVTSADRPFTESERNFLTAIRDWGKKIVIVINKIDIFETAEEQAQVVQFVRDNARGLLGITPEVFPLSARLALRAKAGADGADLTANPWWQASQFEPFERYIHETLNEQSRIRLKLLNPLGVGLKLVGDVRGTMEERRVLLSDDLKTIEVVERQLVTYREDMQAEFERRFDRVDNTILEMRVRGEEFFDERLRLRRAFDLLNSGRLAEDFERIVVADTPQVVENQVQAMIDWMVEREMREWRVIARELSRRQKTEFLGSAASEAAGGFEYNRRELLDSVGKTAVQVVSRYDRQVESQALVEGVQDALAGTALVGVGAVSLGIILHALLASAMADATGILAASVIGALGLAILPYKKGQAKADLRAKTEELRTVLRESLGKEFESQLDRSVERLMEALGPYSRFIRSEHERLVSVQAELDDVGQGLRDVRDQIDRVLPERAPANAATPTGVLQLPSPFGRGSG